MPRYLVELDPENPGPTLTALHTLLLAGVAADDVQWRALDSVQAELFSATPALAGADDQGAAPPNDDHVGPAAGRITPAPPVLNAPARYPPDWAAAGLPPAFHALARLVAMHSDTDRFTLLHRMAQRTQADPRHWHDTLAPEHARLQALARQVRREIHKVHAFVRFRPVDTPTGVRHVAWFEPEHAVMRAAAPFFVKRFAAMDWSILTPRLSLHWDRQRLRHEAGAAHADAPSADAGEALWLAYYASIFNPARVNPAAMACEMPRRYWAALPEARLISQLVREAPERSARMQASASHNLRRLPMAAVPPIQRAPPTPQARLQDLARRARHCTDCPLGPKATQTVWGEGPVGATLMLVGEQPGDQEDLAGQPFVGPAGQLLRRAIAQLRWPVQALYFTNAVKHFRFELRGKRRLHKTPGQREAAACSQWLEAEIAAVAPQAIVALGSTAASSLLGRSVRVGDCAGQWLRRSDGLAVWVVHHPAAVLRRAESGAPDMAAWVRALAGAWPEAATFDAPD